MANFQGPAQVQGQAIFSSSSVQYHAIGEKSETSDGRAFRYARNGAVALVVGNALQNAATDTAHQNLTPVAAVVGANQIVAALGASAAAENQYAGGLAVIDTTPGIGYVYRIGGHKSVLSSGTITLNLLDEVQVALTTSSRVTLIANAYRGVIQSPTTATGMIVGGCVFPLAIAEYGWVQTGGHGGALIAGTPAIGNALSYSATAGALAINSSTLAIVATIEVAGQAGLVQPVKWLID